ncbi:serine/threonine protein kinase [Streptomyces sp. NPDC051776]|uniref:serine/threonine protein kinase n=1 Tax=Streptomyces sp. NPDC051776 TaxID=3155414 RepID=UPI0034498C13
MDDYAGRVLADRYRLPLPTADSYELLETVAFDTYSGQEVLVRRIPLPEVVDAEVVGADVPEGHSYGAPSPEHGDDPRRPADPVVRRAIDAATAAAALPDHPGLDQVFDVFAEGGSLWVVSERVASRPLVALLARKPMSPHRAAEVAADILTALRALHAHGWTHRNITGRTVLVCEDGRAMLTGLAAGAAEEALCGYDPVPRSGSQRRDVAEAPVGAGGEDGDGGRGGAAGRGGAPRTGTSGRSGDSRVRGEGGHGHGAAGARSARPGAIAAYRAGARAAAGRVQANVHVERDSGSVPVERDIDRGVEGGGGGGACGLPAPRRSQAPGADVTQGRAPWERTAADQPLPSGYLPYEPRPGSPAALPAADPHRDRDERRASGGLPAPRTGQGMESARGRDLENAREHARPALPGPYGDAVPYGDADSFGDAVPYGDADSFGDAVPYGDARSLRPPEAPDRAPLPAPRAGHAAVEPSAEPSIEPSIEPSDEGADAPWDEAAGTDAPWGDPEDGPGGDGHRGPLTQLAAERARQARLVLVGPVTERWAPEQAGPVHGNWRLAPPVGPATDLWALGALLFRAVQGHAPYPEDSAAELVDMVCSEPPAYAEECGPLRPVVESLLRQDPTERPDFEELRGWLRSLVRSAPEPDLGRRTVTVPSLDGAAPADPRRLPVVRRRGELVRRRRVSASPAAHGRHKRAREKRVRGQGADGAPSPRRLGRTLVGLVLLALVAAVAYAVLFMPRADESGGRDRTGPAGTGTSRPGPGDGASHGSQEPQSTEPAGLPEGFAVRRDPAGFALAVDETWERRGENSRGQIRYLGGDFEMIVVPGRDSVDDFGGDPMTYQQDKERELEPFRDSQWSSASGLRRIDVGGTAMAEGTFDWKDSSGRKVHARNLAMIVEGRYHLVLVMGPADERDAVAEFYQQAADTYRPTD